VTSRSILFSHSQRFRFVLPARNFRERAFALAATAVLALATSACSGARTARAGAPSTALRDDDDTAWNQGNPTTAESELAVSKAASETETTRPARIASEGGDTAESDDNASEGDYQTPDDSASSQVGTRPHAPVLELTDAEIAAKVRTDLVSLGAMSIGRTNAGALVNAIPLPESPYWERVAPGGSYCTEETRDALNLALAAVNARFPDTVKVFVGNVSTRYGGRFPPHVSHQSGRDIDIGYFLTKNQMWYATATASNLDVARTWAFVRALTTETDVEVLFMDKSVQLLVHRYALEQGEDRAWVDSLFEYGGGGSRPLIVHVKGHATHIHVRLRNPVAEELGRRAYPFLLRGGIVRPPTLLVKHIAKKGETLSHLAVRYRTTMEVIRKANGLKTDFLLERREYRIPQTGSGIARVAPVLIPPRRLPPRGATAALAPPFERAKEVSDNRTR
jgi:murein endopeptidase